MIHRRMQASIRMLLTMVLLIGIVPSSATNPNDPMKWIGLMPHSNLADLNYVKITHKDSTPPPNEPIFLRYLTQLIGDDWLGADWVYVGLGDYRYPALDEIGQRLYVTNPLTGVKTPQWNYTRFWIDPGPALLKVSDTMWVWGYEVGSHTIYADNILVDPPARIAPPEGVSAFGRVLAISGQTIIIQDPIGIKSTVTVDSSTTYSFLNGEGLPRPKDGLWLHISWLTGPAGLLGRYEGFHGSYRGILRLDFYQP
jgi:hypothetical protein